MPRRLQRLLYRAMAAISAALANHSLVSCNVLSNQQIQVK